MPASQPQLMASPSIKSIMIYDLKSERLRPARMLSIVKTATGSRTMRL